MAFLLILIAHILGDFTFQPGALVLAKNRKWTYLLVHALIYTVPAVILMFSFLRSWVVLLYAPLIFLTHFGTDVLKRYLNRKFENPYAHQIVFLLDQFLHVVILVLIFNLAIPRGISIDNRYYIHIVFAFGILLCLSPASIFIKHVLACVDYETNKKHRQAYLEELEETTDEERRAELKDLLSKCNKSYTTQEIDANKAGSLIGKLERITILILGFMGLYTSIGLVLTAKSLARFKQLEDKEFGEKYLIGTLASVLFPLIILFIMKGEI